MDQHELRRTIEQIMGRDTVGVMATVRENKPFSRYMTFFHADVKLYTATSKETHKANDIEANPYTHILLGYDGEGAGDEYVEYEGKAVISDSDQLKDELWTPYMENWFEGPEDPNYIILEISPIQIRLMNKKGVEPKLLELS